MLMKVQEFEKDMSSACGDEAQKGVSPSHLTSELCTVRALHEGSCV